MSEQEYRDQAKTEAAGLGMAGLGMAHQMFQQEPTARQKSMNQNAPVIVELERAEKNIELLESVITALRGRLHLVMSPQPPRNETGPCSEAGGSIAASAIGIIANRINSQIYELKEIMELLEI